MCVSFQTFFIKKIHRGFSPVDILFQTAFFMKFLLLQRSG